jgi:signal transduction histidine kinase
VVDRISDSFVVINEEYQIIDYNKTMAETFKGILTIERNKNLVKILEKGPFNNKYNKLIDMIDKARAEEISITHDEHIHEGKFDKHFTIEITPIISNHIFLGTIILFKDITENIKHLADIEEKHAIMMEQERLASLGQLIGGISHNLKTPIMSIAGAAEALKDLTKEYEQSMGESGVTIEDHREIASEMYTWIDKIRPYCTYMIDIINAVKGQATNFNMSTILSFTINELVKRIDLLMRYELIKYNCKLNTYINVNYHTELYGDVNNLVQIFDNIIMNAIQAYEGKNGDIDFSVEDKGDSILFIIKDYAKGIPSSIKDRLLKEMVTTKGKDGTGLGLFMSYSTIKGRFGGKMWFESEDGNGTTFFIQLPHNTNC